MRVNHWQRKMFCALCVIKWSYLSKMKNRNHFSSCLPSVTHETTQTLKIEKHSDRTLRPQIFLPVWFALRNFCCELINSLCGPDLKVGRCLLGLIDLMRELGCQVSEQCHPSPDKNDFFAQHLTILTVNFEREASRDTGCYRGWARFFRGHALRNRISAITMITLTNSDRILCSSIWHCLCSRKKSRQIIWRSSIQNKDQAVLLQ